MKGRLRRRETDRRQVSRVPERSTIEGEMFIIPNFASFSGSKLGRYNGVA
jgi:hypothetical protein